MVSTRQQSSSSSGSTAKVVPVLTKHEKSFSTSLGQSNPLHILDLPYEILEKILSYTSFKQISQMRSVSLINLMPKILMFLILIYSQVSQRFNMICSAMLNSTFQRLQNQMLNRFQIIKTKMPRRESARRQHPLACESDIVETLHMRLLLLRMAFGKHIERKHICFFAGEVIFNYYLFILKTITKIWAVA